MTPGRLGLTALLLACQAERPQIGARPPPPPEASVSVDEALFVGSRLQVTGAGFLRAPAGETTVRFEGPSGAGFDWPVEETARDRLVLPLTPDVAGRLGERVAGRLRIEVTPWDHPDLAGAVTVPLTFELRAAPRPALRAVESAALVPGARLAVLGLDLLDRGEGQTLLALAGTFTPDDRALEPRTLEDVRLPLVERDGRTRGTFTLAAGVFGLAPGRFRGRARLEVTPSGGRPVRSEWLEGVDVVQRPISLPPPPALRLARGEVARLPVRGALPLDAAAQTSTVLVLDGVFTPAGGGAPETWSDRPWVPDAVPDAETLRLALRTQPGADERAPLGPPPGRFDGEARIVLRAGRERVSTPPAPFTLEIAPATQHVYLDTTPGFEEGLADFGLAAAADDVRARIRAVCERDYAGLRVFFHDTPPPDAVEFVTVELGGRDPNGLDLLGLESTSRKDTENRRLDERLGGRNALTAESGEPAFGGVFVTSFLKLSPGQPAASVLASPRFDLVFAPFAPALSADAVPSDPAETEPGRRAARDEAVRVVGNLIGSTVTHEVGHALGLSAVPGRVHNPGDWPGDLMDRGEDRPLAERAELDGTGPARFTGPNAEYLVRLFGDP